MDYTRSQALGRLARCRAEFIGLVVKDRGEDLSTAEMQRALGLRGEITALKEALGGAVPDG